MKPSPTGTTLNVFRGSVSLVGMRFTILGCGTSTGVPVPGCRCGVCRSTDLRNHRLRTSGIIQSEDGRALLIDASADLRQQTLRAGIERIDGVLYTHTHADHILGTDDLRCFNYTLQRRIPCYGTRTTLDEIRRFFNYIFDPRPNYEGGALAQLDLHEIEDTVPFEAAGFGVHPFPLEHGSSPVTGYRVGALAYATDCNKVPAQAREILRGVRYLILDGLRFEAHRTHFTIPEAIKVAQEIGAERTILVHMTHSIDFETVSAQLPPGIELGYDGLTLTF
jgi:phosphoribosyl 1,2-cyclic phosphate phosphodiesterase